MPLTKQYDNKMVNKNVTFFKMNVIAFKTAGGENSLAKKLVMDRKRRKFIRQQSSYGYKMV